MDIGTILAIFIGASSVVGSIAGPLIARSATLKAERIHTTLTSKQEVFSDFAGSFHIFHSLRNPFDSQKLEHSDREMNAYLAHSFRTVRKKAYRAYVYCNPDTAYAISVFLNKFHYTYWANDQDTANELESLFNQCVECMRAELDELRYSHKERMVIKKNHPHQKLETYTYKK